MSAHQAVRFEEETPEKRQERLQNITHKAVHLHEETPEMRQERLQNVSKCRS